MLYKTYRNSRLITTDSYESCGSIFKTGATLKYLNALGFLALGIFVRATSQELG